MKESKLSHLLIIEDRQGKRTMALKAATYLIGRDSCNSIVLNSPFVSRQHAILLRVTTPAIASYLFRIIDLNLQGKRSTNGLMVNGEYCFSHDLKNGDVIIFAGDVRARYYVTTNSSDVDLLTSCAPEEVSGFLSTSSIAIPAQMGAGTERELETSIDTSLVRLASFPELISIPIVEINLAGSITYLNPAADVQFPGIREERLNHPILAGIISTIQDGKERFFRREVEVDNKVFEQDVHFLAESELIRIYVIDITERKRVEVALQQAHDELELRVKERTAELQKANEQLREEIIERQRAEQEVRFLQTMTQAISESEDFHSALGVVLQKVCFFTGWKFGEAWIPSSDGTVLESSSAWYGSNQKLEKFRLLSEGLTFTPGTGLPGSVWLSKQPEWIQDIRLQADTVFRRKQLASQAGFKAGLGIPIIDKEQVLAVLVFFMFKSCEEDKRLIEIVSTVATQLGSLIQRKRAEEALRESQQMLHLVIDNIPQFIFWKDKNSVYLGCNYNFAQIAGVSKPENIVGKTDYDLPWRQEETDFFREYDRRVMDTGTPEYHVMETLLRADGKQAWLDTNRVPLHNSRGKIVGLLGTFEDITERKRALDALHSSMATNRALLNAIPDWMFRIQSDGTFVNFKAAKGDHLPMLTSEFLGKNLCEVWPTDVAQPAMNCVETALSSGEIQIFEYQLLVNGALRDYEVRIALSAQEEVLALVRDITKRKRAEEDIRNALEKEKQLNELKSRFISMASHEFRTPLATILSSAELLEHYSHKWSEEKKLTHLQRIQTAVKHMNELLHDVLLIGKAEAGKLECKLTPLDLAQFCRNLVEEIQITASTHTLIFRTQGQCTNAEMDEKLLRHILSNLLSNALKYSPAGGQVYFDLIWEHSDAIFRIQDEGIGIPEADQNKLFDSFHRASNVGTISGTGLGLAIVKKSVDLHGGSIAVESYVGVGTTFTITLPKKYAGTNI